MPYYAVGDYYGRGDYYRGDPGLFGSIGKFLGKAVKTVGKALIPSPVRAIAEVVGGAVSGGKPKLHAPFPLSLATGFAPVLMGGTPLGISQVDRGFNGAAIPAFRRFGGKRRQMNPMNVKALRRASRRIDGFARTARKALKHTPWILVSRSSRRGGSPGVITRAEAARALRK